METKDIIIEEMIKIISELKSNQKLNTDVANASIKEINNELEKTALDLLYLSPEEVFKKIKEEYYQAVLQEGLVSPGIATIIEDSKECIYLAKYAGNIGDETKTLVSAKTRFDLASITKLFTVLEALKLNQEGLFDVNQIVREINRSPYTTLNVTVADILRFKYELLTNGRTDEKNITSPQFFRRLLRPKIGYNTHLYSDIPYIITKTLLPESRKFFNEYSNELELLSTSYSLSGEITGGFDFTSVADEKARLMLNMGIQPGHAGLFSTADDLINVFDGLNNGFLNKDSLDMLVNPDTSENYVPAYDEKGNIIGKRAVSRAMGVYIEHPDGLKVSEVIPGLSKYAFSITGYTGGYATYDVVNGLSSVILANPLTIASTKEKVLVNNIPDNNKYLLDLNGKPYEKGLIITSKYDGKKLINIYSKDGEYLETRTYTNLLDSLKKQQIYTLLKLRLTKRVAKLLATSDNLIDHIEEEYRGGKVFKNVRKY